MFQVVAYIKFLFRSTNQHGVHSPFVYNLLTKCLYVKDKKPSYDSIRKYLRAVQHDPQIIKVTDFGAGSKVFKSNNRKVGEIAKNAGISLRRAILLNKLVSYFQFNSGLELGTSVGISSAAIATNNPIQLTSLEGCPETAKVAQNYFKKFGLNTIKLKVGEFDESLKAIINEESSSFDLIYFDGNHQKTPTLDYFKLLLPLAHNDSVFIFDDIHWSKEMEEAWEVIKSHPKVRVSIDSYFWGLIFFRAEQEKEHFTLRL